MKEERVVGDKDDKSVLPETMFTSQIRDKLKLPGPKQNDLHAVPGIEASISRKSKLGQELESERNASAELKEHLTPDRTWKKRLPKSCLS